MEKHRGGIGHLLVRVCGVSLPDAATHHPLIKEWFASEHKKQVRVCVTEYVLYGESNLV